MSPSIHSNTDDKSLNMNITGEEQLPTKQEERTNVNTISRGPYPSEICLGTKDSRIMRISRSFGGKDRHSKVFTARGLRDRRVRLSVQTAIQLYDLQDRLGLNQPSKVVDWLLNVAQREIDLLPPLQMPAENFSQYHQIAASHEVAASQVPFSSCFGVNPENIRCTGAHSSDVKSKDNINSADHAASSESIYWKSNSPFRAGSKEVRREIIFEKGDRYKWNEHENQKAIAVRGTQEFPSNSLHKPPYTSCYQWEWPSNHYEIGGTYNSSNSDVQSSPSLPSRSQPQLLLYPSETIPSNAPCYVGALLDHVPKQMNHIYIDVELNYAESPVKFYRHISLLMI